MLLSPIFTGPMISMTPSSTTSATSSTLQAVFWMLGGLSCFSLLAIASRELTADLSPVHILFWRSLLGLGIVTLIMARHGNRPLFEKLKTTQWRWHFLRNSSHFAGQCAWLLAIAAIPLAEVFALEFTTPLWAALLAAVFLGERLNPARLVAGLLGLLGVMVILQPGISAIHPASLIMLAGAFGFAISVITTRYITRLDSPLLVLFYMTLMQTLFAFPLSLSEWRWPAGYQWWWLGAAGITALAAHFCLTKALSLADASIVMPIDYLRLPLITLVAWWLYQEPLTWPVAAGALLILSGNAVGLYGEKKYSNARRAHRSPTLNNRAQGN